MTYLDSSSFGIFLFNHPWSWSCDSSLHHILHQLGLYPRVLPDTLCSLICDTLHAPLIRRCICLSLIRYISERIPGAPTHFNKRTPRAMLGETETPNNWTAGCNSEQGELPLTKRSIFQPLCRQELAPQAAGCCCLAEAALWWPTERGKWRHFSYRRSILYHFKAEIHNLLHV